MGKLFDHQIANLADFDCFSQVVFKSVDHYKQMKEDPWYKQHLVGDHKNFANIKTSMMTIGWITEFIRDGEVVDGMKTVRKNSFYLNKVLQNVVPCLICSVLFTNHILVEIAYEKCDRNIREAISFRIHWLWDVGARECRS